jgi:hypothetical protein
LGSAPLLVAVATPPVPSPKEANVTLEGKVVPVSEALKADGALLDRDAEPAWLALSQADGKLIPLVKDAGSRMFFKDKQLLNRSMRLTGRRVGNGAFFQVVSVRSVIKGKVHEPYYWCDICAIKRSEPNDCDCCGAPLEFREQMISD